MKDSQVNNRIELTEYFRTLGYRVGAEIGVFDGRYSEILCQNIPGLTLLCIDTWPKERILKLAVEKLAPYNARLIRKKSTDAAEDIADESLDFVFIDADHKYESVKDDIGAWSKKVKKGGIISGHDYYVFRWSKNSGVVDAVNEYTKENDYKLFTTPWQDKSVYKDDRPPIWYFFK